MSEFKNLPKDIANAIDTYDNDVATGKIIFDGNFASDYPGHDASDKALGEFVKSKIAE